MYEMQVRMTLVVGDPPTQCPHTDSLAPVRGICNLCWLCAGQHTPVAHLRFPQTPVHLCEVYRHQEERGFVRIGDDTAPAMNAFEVLPCSLWIRRIHIEATA